MDIQTGLHMLEITLADAQFEYPEDIFCHDWGHNTIQRNSTGQYCTSTGGSHCSMKSRSRAQGHVGA